MDDQMRIDSHKLHLHPGRVADWMRDGDAFPLYMEFSPSGGCNFRCTFCGMDHMGYKNRHLETGLVKTRIAELATLGLKSIMFAGEGEPLLHKDIAEISIHTKSVGIDVSFTTNGSLLTETLATALLPVTSWIKISINAIKPETYAAIHKVKGDMVEKVLGNMRNAVAIRSRTGSTCTIGAQMLLLPENHDEAVELARSCREAGADYFVVKPYSQNPQSLTQVYTGIQYRDVEELQSRMKTLETDTFKVHVRLKSIQKQGMERPYASCQALPFWARLDSDGTLWSCIDHIGDEHFRLGNIYQNTFEEIWHGEQRKSAMDWFKANFDCSVCRVNCRMDEVNRYLWELKNPSPHANFI